MFISTVLPGNRSPVVLNMLMRYRTWHLHVAALLPPIPPKFLCLLLHMNGSGAGSPCGPPIARVLIRPW